MVAKGFKRNYFSLSAITATVSMIKFLKLKAAIKRFLFKNFKPKERVPLKESKPCYCNIFFACLAHKVLRLTKIKKAPICRCRKTKTGVAPPFLFTY